MQESRSEEEDFDMGTPPFLNDFRMPPSPQILILEELRQTNTYLEIMMEMFRNVFPQSVPAATASEIEKAKDQRRKIGFKPEDAESQ